MIDSLEVFAPLFDELNDAGHGEWVDVLRGQSQRIMDPVKCGHFSKWNSAIGTMPKLTATDSDFCTDAVSVRGVCSDEERGQLKACLAELHPWRKGPFDLFGVFVDTEWRSHLKWSRVQSHLNQVGKNFKGKNVLDVGCGNGYYGWRMIGDGARCVVGLEPYPLYNAQFRAIQQWLPAESNYVLPSNDQVLASRLEFFDYAFSMGVLYHTKNPIGHLESLRRSVKTGGTVVVETLVLDGDDRTILVPEDRYAKMRNVWLLPSPLALERLLRRVGFRDVTIVDVTQTTILEQRSTEWMTFESLADYLSPTDSTKTIEGYPSPLRAIVFATT